MKISVFPLSARGTPRRLLWSLSVAALLSASWGVAQELPGPVSGPDASVVPPPPQAAMPLGYVSGYRQESAREYLQRRAQAKVESRQARLDAMRWMGYSPSRPTVTAVPFSGYTPTWGAYSVGHYWSHPFWHHPVNFGY